MLRTTNIIENLNGSVERYARNLKRWRAGQMIQRWAASALVEAEPRFRRVRGYRHLRHLVGAFDVLAPPDSLGADVAQRGQPRRGHEGTATREVQQRTGHSMPRLIRSFRGRSVSRRLGAYGNRETSSNGPEEADGA